MAKVDRIYAAREKRKWLKVTYVLCCLFLADRKLKPESYYQKFIRKKQALERNYIEAKFDKGNRRYISIISGTGSRRTSESWIGKYIHRNKSGSHGI
ncbi:MAG: hypothetical protein ACOCRK_07505 [bacterium]